MHSWSLCAKAKSSALGPLHVQFGLANPDMGCSSFGTEWNLSITTLDTSRRGTGLCKPSSDRNHCDLQNPWAIGGQRNLRCTMLFSCGKQALHQCVCPVALCSRAIWRHKDIGSIWHRSPLKTTTLTVFLGIKPRAQSCHYQGFRASQKERPSWCATTGCAIRPSHCPACTKERQKAILEGPKHLYNTLGRAAMFFWVDTSYLTTWTRRVKQLERKTS